MANALGAGMFGIAAGSTLQNEATDPALLRRDLHEDRTAGARWIRLDINWAQIQQHGPQSFFWDDIDAAVRGAEADGMRVLGTIVFTPGWARPATATASFAPSPGLYARFAGIAAHHYARLGVRDFEIWNEPNVSTFWTPQPSPEAYTALLRAAYLAIKRADPGATVISGGLAPAATADGNYSPVAFLARVYADGGRRSFDAVGAHPYCWPAYPGDGFAWSGWYQMYGAHPSLRSVMVAHGDGAKKIWGTEFGAPTAGPAGTHVSEAAQAVMIRRAYRLFAGYRWAGPLFLYSSRDTGSSDQTPQDSFGVLTQDFVPKPGFEAYRDTMLSVRRLAAASRVR